MRNQLAFFPTPYDDEDFKSLIYRYHIRSCNVNIGYTLEELFNVKTHRLPHYPRNLDYFVKKLPDNHLVTSDYFIEKHTLLALYLPFLADDEIDQVLGDVRCAKDSSKIGARFLSLIVSTFLRYCPICLGEDYKRVGECYIHRAHQYNFVSVCHEHRSKLITHCGQCGIQLSDSYGRFILRKPACPNGHYLGEDITAEKTPINVQLFNEKLARDVKFIIDNVSKLNVGLFKQRMLKWCTYKQYLLPSGAFNNKLFKENFIVMFDHQLLKSVGLSLNYLSHRAALKTLNFNGDIKNPLLHILGMEYLSQSVECFVYGKIPRLPYGDGPWNCTNPICRDYQRPVIHGCKRKYSKAKLNVIGEFTCPSCGYRYMLTSDVETTEKGFDMVLSIGWRAAAILLNCYLKNEDPGLILQSLRVKPRQRMILEKKAFKVIQNAKQCSLDLRAILAMLIKAESFENVLDSMDINYFFIDFLINPFGWKYGTKVVSDLEKDKLLLLECVKSCSDRESIKQKVGQITYNKLLKREASWMKAVLPPRDHHFISLDWEQIDVEIEATLTQVVSTIYSLPPRNRIQKYTILKRLSSRDKARIQRFPERMPRTINLLEKSIESIQAYQIRRIPDIIEQVKESTWALTLDNILKHKVLLGCSKRVREETSRQLDLYRDHVF